MIKIDGLFKGPLALSARAMTRSIPGVLMFSNLTQAGIELSNIQIDGELGV
jgi:hypothetical protein